MGLYGSQVAFLQLPDATLTPAPGPDSSPPVQVPNRPDVSYDWQLRKWLPVPLEYQSPDGRRYATADLNSFSGVHVVDVASGHDNVFRYPDGTRFRVLAWLEDGIYLNAGIPAGGEVFGIWRLDPSTGKFTVLLKGNHPNAVTPGYAWGYNDTSPGDFTRWSLADESEQVWGPPAYLLSLTASGQALVETTNFGSSGDVVPSTGSVVKILSAPGDSGRPLYPAADGRLWAVRQGSVVFVGGTSGLWRVGADGSATELVSQTVHPAGRCQPAFPIASPRPQQ